VPIFAKRKFLKSLYTILFLFFITNLFAQQSNSAVKREIKYTLEAGTIISSNGETPFWLRANQYGTVPLTSPIFTLRGSVSSDYKKAVTKEDQYKLSKFDWGYGLNIVGNVGKENQILIPEVYLKAKYGAFEIYAGRRKEIVGLVDTALSSGSYIWSGNALPMPKVQISTPNFVPLGFTGGFLSFKGSYAHGWFENNRSDVKDFYLHQKTLYFRLGKPDWKFHFYGGFNHQVQWGGELLYIDPQLMSITKKKLPSTFEDYLGIIVGKSLATESDTSKFNPADALNRAGNHLGTIDLGFQLNFRKFDVLLYRQSIFEDGSLFFLNNINDGLNGVNVNLRENHSSIFSVSKIVVEYLNTDSQGGSVGSTTLNSRLRGQDNYFNNGQYFEGWSYQRQGIGTPLITNSVLIFDDKSIPYFYNNRVQSYYLGIQASIYDKLNIEIRMNVNNNLGSYGHPLKERIDKGESPPSFSFLCKVIKPSRLLNKSKLFLITSYDQKQTLKSSFGTMVGIRKEL
jgi:Capsule assembly protein Wzi